MSDRLNRSTKLALEGVAILLHDQNWHDNIRLARASVGALLKYSSAPNADRAKLEMAEALRCAAGSDLVGAVQKEKTMETTKLTYDEARQAVAEWAYDPAFREALEKIPQHMRAPFCHYVAEGRRPAIDGFLERLLCNAPVFKVVPKADDQNLRALRDWVLLIYNFAPGGCHGSAQLFEAWCENGGLAGEKDAAA